jgi:16S rRNA (guanine527-N7)-methyltransferase
MDRVLSLLWGRPLSARARTRLETYLDEVVRWGSRVDLTAPRSAAELVDLSLADAAVLARLGIEHGQAGDEWLDVGSGGGAPGLPLFVLLEDALGVELVARLVEPREKRTAFLRSVVGQLGFRRVTVERARSEKLESSSADVAVARATLPPLEWLDEGSRLSRRDVWLLLAREAAPEPGAREVFADVRYEWPLTGAQRRVVGYRTTVA